MKLWKWLNWQKESERREKEKNQNQTKTDLINKENENKNKKTGRSFSFVYRKIHRDLVWVLVGFPIETHLLFFHFPMILLFFLLSFSFPPWFSGFFFLLFTSSVSFSLLFLSYYKEINKANKLWYCILLV